MIKLLSFGFRTKSVPKDAFIFDCRGLSNPHYKPALRHLDGASRAVQDFVKGDWNFQKVYGEAKFQAMAFKDPTIAFGCYGGRHRSVAMAELLAAELRGMGHQVEVMHREMATVS